MFNGVDLKIFVQNFLKQRLLRASIAYRVCGGGLPVSKIIIRKRNNFKTSSAVVLLKSDVMAGYGLEFSLVSHRSWQCHWLINLTQVKTLT